MSFRDKSYDERRNDTMFDLSERRFELLWNGPFMKYGLGELADQMASWKLDGMIRHTPDYIAAMYDNTKPFFVEVQGTGGNPPYTHRFKKMKMDELGKWDRIDKVTLWLWNDATQTFIWTSYKSVRMAILQGKASEGTFDGKRPYWALPEETLLEIEDSEQLRKEFCGR